MSKFLLSVLNSALGTPNPQIINWQRSSALIITVFAVAMSSTLAPAQQPIKAQRIGYLAAVSAAADAPRMEAFRQGLREFGHVEGQNLSIEFRHEGRTFDRLPGLAAELIASKINVLVGVTTNAALAAQNATSTIPIVFMGVTDPV